ncbi:MAG: hypothetical protein AAF390_08505 [Pseudomonadota bacterium]
MRANGSANAATSGRGWEARRLAGLLEGEDLPVRLREAWMGKPKPSVAELMAGVERE